MHMISLVVLMTVLACLSNAHGQQTGDAVAAPLPSQVAIAKKLFIANGAGDNDSNVSNFTGGPDGLYNQFSASLRSLGGYDLVRTPSEADLVLELAVTYG
jgi:hypothetical protein